MKISVITISFNAEDCIEKTICSVISQKYEDFEYIIVDGASHDKTVSIIEKYGNRISKWISEPDSGIYNAMNKGIAMAEGNYCIFMNAGDMFINDLVLKQVAFFLDDGWDVLTGIEISLMKEKVVGYVVPPVKLTKDHLLRSSISHQSTFIKRKALLQYPYDESLSMVSDWKFWWQAVILGGMKYRPIDVEICYFNHDGITFRNKEKGNKERIRVLQEILSKDELSLWENELCENKRNYIYKIINKINIKLLLDKLSRIIQNRYKYIHEMGIIGVLVIIADLLSHIPFIDNKFRQNKQRFILSYLKRNLGGVVINYSYKPVYIENERIIWVCWWQGERMMPLIPKICLANLRRISNDIKVVLVDKNNFSEYIKLPDSLIRKFEKGDVGVAHFTDVLRFNLLQKYGGLWIDSTDYVSTIELNKYVSSSFFTMKGQNTQDSKYPSHFRWTSHLIGGKPNKCFSLMCVLFEKYIEEHRYFLDYLLLDYLLALIYELDDESRKIIDENEPNNEGILSLATQMESAYDKSNWELMMKKSDFHKLTWKKHFHCYKDGKETNFGHIVSSF